MVYDGIPLKVAFPRIFALAVNQEGFISELGKWNKLKWEWDVTLRIDSFDWEVNQWNCFKKWLEGIVVRKDVEDTVAWNFFSSRLFSICSFRNKLEDFVGSLTYGFSLPWKGWCPSKIEFFTWQLLKGRVFVAEVLQKFGMVYVGGGLKYLQIEISKAGGRAGKVYVQLRQRKRKDQTTEAWIPPIGNVLKFNVDGSAFGNPGSAGIGGEGGLDCWGKVTCMFSFNVGIQDSNTVEVMAIHKEVDLCCSSPLCSCREIVFESDSKVAVSWTNGKGIGNFALVQSIYDIRSNLNLLEGEVKFKSRASNQFADSLAKNCSNCGGDFVEWGDCG
ncbi:hypothetical protein Ddye_022597 [Dipteronia dyeriana]|uniref:RNase H type-1 domain-containing protein n=1 Tax=Dipteronia dyeriana TaxID=168575 RepID=A0AAD9TS84_9ROSI|nr:hypothetical protein Ddye_022597 [Dipteronia dyeriana]